MSEAECDHGHDDDHSNGDNKSHSKNNHDATSSNKGKHAKYSAKSRSPIIDQTGSMDAPKLHQVLVKRVKQKLDQLKLKD